MSSELRRRLQLAALVTLLTIALTLLIARLSGGFVRDLVAVPFLYLAWIARVYVRTIPRTLFWGGLLLFGVALALTNAVIGLSKRGEEAEEWARGSGLQESYTHEVRQIASQIRFAGRSAYFSRRLAKRLGGLLVQAVDNGEYYRAVEIQRRLDALDAPPEVRMFFAEAEELVPASRSAGPLARLRRRLFGPTDSEASLENLERTVQFLEDRLEVL